MAKYGMVIDLQRCTGCRSCMEACKVENNTPQASFFMYVFRFEEGEYPNVNMTTLPRPCMHCDNAPCTKVCPVGARYKRSDGLVATDYDRCIGCRYCEVSCPYSVNYFNWKRPEKNYYLDWNEQQNVKEFTGGAAVPYQNPDLENKYGPEKRRIAGGGHKKGVVEKCTFCVHRIEKGLKPACAGTCPTSAINFGDLDDPNSEVSRLLSNNRSFTLLDGLGTKPRVHYIGGTPPNGDTRQLEPITRRV